MDILKKLIRNITINESYKRICGLLSPISNDKF